MTHTPPTGPQAPEPQNHRRHLPTVHRPDASDWHELTDQQRVEWLERTDPVDLRRIIASQAAIEQAKGIMMGHYGCSAAVAFTILTRLSQRTNVKLREVAFVVIQIATEGPSSTSRAASSLVEDVTSKLGSDSTSLPDIK